MNKIRYMIAVLTVIVFTAIDQITKYLVVSKIGFRGSKTVIKEFFYINYVRNTGSAFRFLADRSWGIYVLSAFSIVMTIFIIGITYKALSIDLRLVAVCGVLLTVGAIGNLIDRIRLGYVVDFLRFDFGSYTFPIFNVADICAVCGTILFILLIIFKSKDVDLLFAKYASEKGESQDEVDK